MIRKLSTFLAASFLALACCANAVTDFRVDGDGGIAEQNSPRIAAYGSGKFAVVWVDKRNGTNDIYLRHFDSLAQPVGTEVIINDDQVIRNDTVINIPQFEPSIGIDVLGNAGIVWEDYRNSNYPFDPDIYLQRFSSAGSWLGANVELTQELPDSMKESPDISYSSWGDGVVVWADYRNRDWDIYGQRINAVGGLKGTNFKINDDTGIEPQNAPRVACSADGWFVVVWYDMRGGNYDIYAQLYDSLANKKGPNFRVNTDNGDVRQAFPDVAADGRGRFTVVWTDWRNGVYPSNPDIYVCKMDTSRTALTSNVKMNTDGTTRAQREPAIAADRSGNVAVVWGDSTSKSWNIVGQMIDVDGVVREANFASHEFLDSAQLRPDVAVDGRRRYVTWIDKRNGNFDIYASVETYNNPSLIADPELLTFSMNKGGQNPTAKTVAVSAVGYNELGFKVLEDMSWLTVTPSPTMTPATLSLQANGSSLDYGSYSGLVTLVDTINHDSSVTVSVQLSVVQPQLELSNDTIHITGVPLSATPRSATFDVTNAIGSSMAFSVSESTSWLTVSADTGSAPETITASCSAVLFTSGTYSAPITVASEGAIGSPDTVWVEFAIASDYPVFSPSNDTLYLRTSAIGSASLELVVGNSGTAPLDWALTSYDSWMIPSRLTGTDNDTVGLVFYPTLKSMPYGGSMTLSDTSFGIDTTISVILDYYVDSSDSIKVDSAVLPPQSTAPIHGSMILESATTAAFMRIVTDTSIIAIDSAAIDSVVGETASVTTQVTKEVSQSLLTVDMADTLGAGTIVYYSLWATTGSTAGATVFDTAMTLTSYTHLVSPGGAWRSPTIAFGSISIDAGTAVPNDPNPALPESFFLAQNYPNPFNASTIIEFGIPRRTDVKLELFNVVGQTVRMLFAGPLPAGTHIVEWDGTAENGSAVPSGVYFYRLSARELRLVKKLVVVK